MKLTTAAQMKELDRQAIEEYGIASLELMERAANGAGKTTLIRIINRITAPDAGRVLFGDREIAPASDICPRNGVSTRR